MTSEPGTAYRYSGGGYQVVQQVLEDLAGGPGYAALAQARVFDPAGMSRSSLLDPLDPEGAASAHDEDGRVLAGRWHRYPELTAAAVWTTPSDLLRFALRLQLSYRGVSDTLLPGAVTRRMLTRQRPTDTAGQSIGLGVFLEAPADGRFFQHGGANAGYRCSMLGYLERPLALAIMTNSEVGDRLFQPVVDAVVAAYSTWDAGSFRSQHDDRVHACGAEGRDVGLPSRIRPAVGSLFSTPLGVAGTSRLSPSVSP